MKLINTPDYLLLIDEEAKLSVTDIIYNTLNCCIAQIHFSEQVCDDFKKIIAYYPLTKEAKELDGLPLLPNPFKEDINKQAEEFANNNKSKFNNWYGAFEGYKAGYKAAQSKQ